MKVVLIISILIIIVILILAVLTVNKGYNFKHTIDPIEPEANVNPRDEQKLTKK